MYDGRSATDMPKDVADAVREIFQNVGNMDSNDAAKLYRRLEIAKRIQMETWSG